LSNLASWFAAGKVKGSDVVIVSYVDPNSSAIMGAAAQTLTQRQSEAVLEFLRETQKVQRMGWLSSRPITALGMGASLPPVPEKEPLPPNRVEILVFCPR
jgi:hypothetical protein